jgi:tRNA uridine 5-carboxymethylaminomethyl modification enzyme
VVRFPEKERHQTFIEPEGRDTIEYYPSGLSTSLPIDVQWAFYRSLVGLGRVEIMRPAYAIEYDYVDPIQIKPSLETKKIRNLYHAGQINGTSGYEEAAAQGLIAGINASLRTQGKEPLILGRGDAYIGVMIDDLVTLGTREPYRMFTSRAEYRLLLREDNADLRLRAHGHEVGLVSSATYDDFCVKREAIAAGLEVMKTKRLVPSAYDAGLLAEYGLQSLQNAPTLEQFLRRPEITWDDLVRFVPELGSGSATVHEQIEIQVKYQGYIERQLEDVQRLARMESVALPADFNYQTVASLSTEVREKLETVRPVNLGQAARIPGVTPAAVAILSVLLHKR